MQVVGATEDWGISFSSLLTHERKKLSHGRKSIRQPEMTLMGKHSSKKRLPSSILSGGFLCSEHNANSKMPHACEGHTLGKVKG